MLFQLITSVYTHDGYHFPSKIIRYAKQLAKNIPDTERFETPLDGDMITVFRGSYTEPEKTKVLKREYSWTTDFDTAMFFAYKTSWQMRDNGTEYPPAFLYKAVIPHNEIIAYLTGRNEAEVLQYDNVRDIVLLDPPTDEEVNAMFQRHKDSINKQWEEFKNEYGDEIKEKLISNGYTD